MTGVVAVVGTGNMGGAMAARLLGLQWPVRVRDLVADRMQALEAQGAVACTSAGEAADNCSALVVAVVDAQQTREVLFGEQGAAAVMPRGAAVLLCPTIAPHEVAAIAERLRSLGLAPLDAPMSGGPARALDGSMSLMVASDDASFEASRPLLDALSSRVFRVGTRWGDGARTKLVNNLLAAINLAGAAEALAMAQHMGLDAERTLEVIAASSGQSWIGSDRMPRALQGDFSPRAHMTLLAKDSRLAVEAAVAAGFDGTLGPIARDVFARALQAGMEAEDDAALFRFFGGRSLLR